MTTIRGARISLWNKMRRAVVPYDWLHFAAPSNFQPSTAFIMSFFRRPREILGPPQASGSEGNRSRGRLGCARCAPYLGTHHGADTSTLNLCVLTIS
jgi:hypothetical protein